MGFGREHIASLIEMATDEALNNGDPSSLEVWAPVHAGRTLGQLKAEEAVEPLIGLLRRFDVDDDHFVGEELPKVFGMIGGNAIPALEKFIRDDSNGVFDRIAAMHGLERIANADPGCRDRCVSILTEKLTSFEQNDSTFNAFLILYLTELDASEAFDVISRAYASQCVDLSVMGDLEDVEISLGFKRYRNHPSPFDDAIDDLNRGALSSKPSAPVRREKIGRNSPCPCGSGKKYKKCCLDR
jgi:HEAT repeat protein